MEKIHEAANDGDTSRIRKCLRNGANVNTCASLWQCHLSEDFFIEDFTPLHLSAAKGHLEATHLLVTNGADINATTHWDRTPLHLATWAGVNSIVDLLLSEGAQVNLKDNDGCTPLRVAAEMGRTEIVSLLIRNGAEVDLEDKNGNTPLHAAAGEGHHETIEVLLSYGANLNAQNSEGYTPLHEAASKGRKGSLRILIKNGADLHLQNNNAETPLFCAAVYANCRESVDLLFSNGADYSIFEMAAVGDLENTQNQIAKGFNLAERNSRGKTLIHWAAWNGHIELVRFLLENGAAVGTLTRPDPHFPNPKAAIFDWTPIHYAAHICNEGLISLLLKYGADVNAKDSIGKTPLYYAITSSSSKSEQVIAITALLQGNARVKSQHIKMAEFYGHKELMKLLQRHKKWWHF